MRNVSLEPQRTAQVGKSAEKLIQLGCTSQQRHVGFQRSTPSSEKAPSSRSPSLHALPLTEGNPCVDAGFCSRLLRQASRLVLLCFVQYIAVRPEHLVRTEDAQSCTGSAARNG